MKTYILRPAQTVQRQSRPASVPAADLRPRAPVRPRLGHRVGWSLITLAYNLKRVLNLVSFEQLMAAVS